MGLKHNATNKGALERIGYAYLTSPLTGVNGSPIIRISNGRMIQNIFIDLYCTQREALKIRIQVYNPGPIKRDRIAFVSHFAAYASILLLASSWTK